MSGPLTWARHSWRKPALKLDADDWVSSREQRARFHEILRNAMAAAERAGIKCKVTVTYPNIIGPAEAPEDRL